MPSQSTSLRPRFNSTSKTHLYIVVGCKTGDCKTVQVLMHLGEKGMTPAKVEYWMSYPLMLNCQTCGKTYDYPDSDDEFWQKELTPPPPEQIHFGRKLKPHPALAVKLH